MPTGGYRTNFALGSSWKSDKVTGTRQEGSEAKVRAVV